MAYEGNLYLKQCINNLFSLHQIKPKLYLKRFHKAQNNIIISVFFFKQETLNVERKILAQRLIIFYFRERKIVDPNNKMVGFKHYSY